MVPPKMFFFFFFFFSRRKIAPIKPEKRRGPVWLENWFFDECHAKLKLPGHIRTPTLPEKNMLKRASSVALTPFWGGSWRQARLVAG